jgi:hypothetical protein
VIVLVIIFIIIILIVLVLVRAMPQCRNDEEVRHRIESAGAHNAEVLINPARRRRFRAVRRVLDRVRRREKEKDNDDDYCLGTGFKWNF